MDDLTADLEAAHARLAEAPAVEARAFAAERARVEVCHYLRAACKLRRVHLPTCLADADMLSARCLSSLRRMEVGPR